MMNRVIVVYFLMADRGLDKVFYGLEEPALMFGG